MHYSGLLVLCDPSSTEACVGHLNRCPGVDVYVTEDGSGRIVVVLETETLEEQEAGLRQVQALPFVRAAELVYHYFGESDSVPEDGVALTAHPDGDPHLEFDSNPDSSDEPMS
jgi:nitrate reductase NapAB chaperone NapD